MRIEGEIKLAFDDVMIRPKRSTLVSRSDVTLKRKFSFKHTSRTWEGVPVSAANMDTTGVFDVARVLQGHNMMTCLQKFSSVRDLEKAWEEGVDARYVAVTCGSTEDSFQLLRRKLATNDDLSMICIDVANGYREVFLEFVKKVRSDFPDKIIIAGNVATNEMTEALILAGADIVKVGIGPGSICTTRLVAGIGVPQLSAIISVKNGIKNKDIKIISDGGIKYSGDLAKAFAAGADAVMIGSLFAGTDETPGKLIKKNGKMFKSFRGMGSVGAMNKGSADRYFQIKQKDNSKYVPEGVEGFVRYKGKVGLIIFKLIGGLKSSMGYLGSKVIGKLRYKANFVKITKAGFYESMVHNVDVVKNDDKY